MTSAGRTVIAILTDGDEVVTRFVMGRLLRCIRWTDVLILEGTPVLGVAFSIGLTTAPNLTRIILFLGAAFLLLVHIFTLNDWADFQHSKAEPSARTIEVPCEAISPQLLLVFSVLCLVIGLILLAFLGIGLFILGITVAALGILYSHPRSPSPPVIPSRKCETFTKIAKSVPRPMRSSLVHDRIFSPV